MTDPCECQAKVHDIGRIVKVSFVSEFKFVRYIEAISVSMPN